MKKALALLLVATFVLGLAACSKKNELVDEIPEIDMTPSITREELIEEVDFETAEFATAEDGEVTIETGRAKVSTEEVEDTDVPTASLRTSLSPDQVWNDSSTASSYSGNGTFTMPEEVQMSDGSLGQLSIPKIGLTVSVYETDDEMEDITYTASTGEDMKLFAMRAADILRDRAMSEARAAEEYALSLKKSISGLDTIPSMSEDEKEATQ